MRSTNVLNIKTTRIEGSSEFSFILLACFLWFTTLSNMVMVVFDNMLHTDMFFRTDGKVIFCIIFLLCSMPYMAKKLKAADYGFFLFIVVLYLLTYVFTSSENEYVKQFLNGFLIAVPMYLVGRSFDFPKYKRLFYIVSVVSIIVCSYYGLFYIQSDSYQGEVQFTRENMSMSYGLLPHVLFMIWYSFDYFDGKKIISWFNIAVTLFGIFSLLMMGTRGPVVCTSIFIVYYLLFYKKPKHRALYFFVIFVLAILFIVFFERILLFFSQLAYSLGFSERIFEKFLYGHLNSYEGTSGRNEFYSILFNALFDSPIWGYGFFGSYYFVQSYPHNIFLDLVFSFGYFFGGSFIIILFNSIYKSFKKTRNKDEKGFLCALIGTGIIGLLFSETFVVSPFFFMCVGYSFQLATRKRAELTL